MFKVSGATRVPRRGPKRTADRRRHRVAVTNISAHKGMRSGRWWSVTAKRSPSRTFGWQRGRCSARSRCPPSGHWSRHPSRSPACYGKGRRGPVTHAALWWWDIPGGARDETAMMAGDFPASVDFDSHGGGFAVAAKSGGAGGNARAAADAVAVPRPVGSVRRSRVTEGPRPLRRRNRSRRALRRCARPAAARGGGSNPASPTSGTVSR